VKTSDSYLHWRASVLPPSASRLLAAAVVALAFSPAIQAQSRDAARLGTELTASGADKSGTAAGVPAWSPVEPQGPGWSYGKRRGDAWKYKDDKPLYTIDAGNVEKYADKLSPGQVLLLKELKGYRLDVYPSRRTCGIPEIVAENSKKNVGFAKMGADGVSLQDAYTPGYPFPMPQSGAEAMWNAKMHYRGVGVEMRNFTTAVSPRRGSSDWIRGVSDMYGFLPWGAKMGATFAKVDRTEASVYFAYTAPAALAGQALVLTTGAGHAPEAFYYFPGQRRTRRMPSYAYDAPQIGMENQYTMDEGFVFAGPLDRFDWKLVGKKEMIVPYNAFGMYDFTSKFEQVAQRDFISPEHRRYELHRVWVVEATVKQGMRHSAPKRVFYLDEDSWILLGAVDYDAQGRVWKVREGHPIPVFETGTCDATVMVQYNVAEGRYVFDNSPVGAGVDFRWITDGAGNSRMKPEFYTSENLRAISER
jgi:hypothetical protein